MMLDGLDFFVQNLLTANGDSREMGMLARNRSQFDEALGYYKTVVEKMPLSGYLL